MNKGTIAYTALGLGAGVTYWRPQPGRAARDIENRTTGLAARAAASLVLQPPPIDDVLAARVRARIGRLVSHPGAVRGARAGV